MQIRKATKHDADAVRRVHLSAFPDGEREAIAKLAVDLLSEGLLPATFSLVAEVDGIVVGHVTFSPVTAQESKDFLGYILAPLAVSPDHQKSGIGSGLIKRGVKLLSEKEPGILLVYGDPDYYGRFGFCGDAAECYTAPHPLQYPFGWQGMRLGDCPERRTPVTIACVSPLNDASLW